MTVRERLAATLRTVMADRGEGVRIVEAVVERLGGADAVAAEGIAVCEAIGFVVNPHRHPRVLRSADYVRLDPAGQEAVFDGGRFVRAGHRWLSLAGRHYDGECPDGVEAWQALPVFRRMA